MIGYGFIAASLLFFGVAVRKLSLVAYMCGYLLLMAGIGAIVGFPIPRSFAPYFFRQEVLVVAATVCGDEDFCVWYMDGNLPRSVIVPSNAELLQNYSKAKKESDEQGIPLWMEYFAGDLEFHPRPWPPDPPKE